MPLYYGSSKLCFDVSRDWTIRKYASNRYYVIAGNGGLGLCRRFPGCEEQYPEGVGKVYFDEIEDMLEKARYYIEHDEERNKIKQAGLDWTKKYHTYPVRIKEILKYARLG
jgi:spore maturation protein CgeB